MPFYETVFMARQELSATQVEELVQAYQKIITSNGGKIHKTENWGLRTLAYRINKNRKAHYALIEMDAPAEAVHELERNMRLSEDVLRYLTTREEKLSEGPSVMMKGADRDSTDSIEEEAA